MSITRSTEKMFPPIVLEKTKEKREESPIVFTSQISTSSFNVLADVSPRCAPSSTLYTKEITVIEAPSDSSLQLFSSTSPGSTDSSCPSTTLREIYRPSSDSTDSSKSSPYSPSPRLKYRTYKEVLQQPASLVNFVTASKVDLSDNQGIIKPIPVSPSIKAVIGSDFTIKEEIQPLPPTEGKSVELESPRRRKCILSTIAEDGKHKPEVVDYEINQELIADAEVSWIFSKIDDLAKKVEKMEVAAKKPESAMAVRGERESDSEDSFGADEESGSISEVAYQALFTRKFSRVVFNQNIQVYTFIQEEKLSRMARNLRKGLNLSVEKMPKKPVILDLDSRLKILRRYSTGSYKE